MSLSFDFYHAATEKWVSGASAYFGMTPLGYKLCLMEYPDSKVACFNSIFRDIMCYLDADSFIASRCRDTVIADFKYLSRFYGFIPFVFDFVQSLHDTFLTSAFMTYCPVPAHDWDLL